MFSVSVSAGFSLTVVSRTILEYIFVWPPCPELK